MELRLNSVEQLGQVRLAIMETNGQISVYYYADDEVKPGRLYPAGYADRAFQNGTGIRRVCLRKM